MKHKCPAYTKLLKKIAFWFITQPKVRPSITLKVPGANVDSAWSYSSSLHIRFADLVCRKTVVFKDVIKRFSVLSVYETVASQFFYPRPLFIRALCTTVHLKQKNFTSSIKKSALKPESIVKSF